MTHGGDIYSRKVELDFSANINPLGMPSGVREALTARIGEFEAYPDANCTALRSALAEREGVDIENIVCGNGASDLIYRLAHVVKAEKALVAAPTFSEYEKAFIEAGTEVSRFYLSEDGGFRLGHEINRFIPPRGAVFLASPNNPDGGLIADEVLEGVIERCRAEGALLILDQCFADFTENGPCRLRPPVAIKAFTKIYAMAGLRLGYLVCAEKELAKKLADYGPCWNVSTPAQIAGLAALSDKTFIPKTRELIARERSFLQMALKELGFKVFPSEGNFLLFKGDKGLDSRLLRRGIAIRCCGDYHGLSDRFYRIAVRSRAENERLVAAIGEILREEK